ncbi:unnamed protein product, partial [Staurois parvus]
MLYALTCLHRSSLSRQYGHLVTRTLHSLYLVSPDPAFTISGLPRPCIHYIWSPRPCTHYIWSPRTLHSLYLVSHSTQNME